MTSLSKKVAESGHWYNQVGNQIGLIENKTREGFRKPNIRDARTHNWGPGVTTICSMLNAPALTAWKMLQAIDAAIELSHLIPEEGINSEWRAKVQKAASEFAQMSAAEGSKIHAALEQSYSGEPFDESYRAQVEGVGALLDKYCGEALELHPWMPEKGVSHPLGYGTKSDLHSGAWVIDFKTKDGNQAKLDDARTYDYHWMQLAATRAALENLMDIPFQTQKCAIVYVSRDNPGACSFREVSEENLSKGWKMFTGLLSVWQAKNDHYPTWCNDGEQL